eukprot:gene7618-9122_t
MFQRNNGSSLSADCVGLDLPFGVQTRVVTAFSLRSTGKGPTRNVAIGAACQYMFTVDRCVAFGFVVAAMNQSMMHMKDGVG